ncbi:hypothetical protein BM449_04980 [Synechococcus sp. SynAce01]|nr:hypothetical protein BM449_04980 [Synechococcus sp. SynAce01]
MEAASVRPGPRQQQLLQLLCEAERELSGQELHQRLKGGQERQGLATVYRGLKQLQRCGLVRCRKLSSGESVYAPLERDEHHLICIQCGHSERLPICPLGTSGLGLTTVLLQGFRPLFHTFEIHGLCSSCQYTGVACHG